MMETFYFTFGISQPNYPGYAKVQAKDVIAARKLMNETFNYRWSFMYRDYEDIDEDDRIERFDLVADDFKDNNLCPSCGKNEAAEPHLCPYAQEIYGDEETTCTCCPECEGQHAADI
jgi:hypothetical protein